MKTITQLVILTLFLLLIDADQYCDKLIRQYNYISTRCPLPTVPINNCCDLSEFLVPSGIYKLKKTAFSCTNVFCNMTTNGGGWIVIQRNMQGSLISFNRNWSEYEEGFGDLHTEFWYGLQNIHYLTRNGQWEMRVDYQFNNKTWSYLHYNQFSVGSASEEYPLTVRGFTGVGTDLFASHQLHGEKFSTPDNDNDKNRRNCAASSKSGWWYKMNCRGVDINQQPPNVHNHAFFTEMKIRTKDCFFQDN